MKSPTPTQIVPRDGGLWLPAAMVQSLIDAAGEACESYDNAADCAHDETERADYARAASEFGRLQVALIEATKGGAPCPE